jgi:hypothetical protein
MTAYKYTEYCKCHTYTSTMRCRPCTQYSITTDYNNLSPSLLAFSKPYQIVHNIVRYTNLPYYLTTIYISACTITINKGTCNRNLKIYAADVYKCSIATTIINYHTYHSIHISLMINTDLWYISPLCTFYRIDVCYYMQCNIYDSKWYYILEYLLQTAISVIFSYPLQHRNSDHIIQQHSNNMPITLRIIRIRHDAVATNTRNYPMMCKKKAQLNNVVIVC